MYELFLSFRGALVGVDDFFSSSLEGISSKGFCRLRGDFVPLWSFFSYPWTVV